MDQPQALAPTPATPRVEQSSDDSRACRECRRRRVQCDGAIPTCAVCQRYRRHCLYDKYGKTRLTRKTLTILEHRLERAEALLRNQYSQQQIADLLDGKVTAPPKSEPSPSVSSTSALQLSHGLDPAQEAPSSVSIGSVWPPQSAITSQPAFTLEPGLADDAGLSGAGQSLADDSFGFDPATPDDFEWNEQESSYSVGPTGDASPQAIMDGMASLTVGERRGYLGAVSGAALLRQVLSSGHRDGQDAQTGDQAQQLDTLFQQRLDRSQWFQTQSMVTRVAVENLFDAFFTFYHPTFPIVHEPTFRAQYAGVLPRQDNEKWVMLANIVAALGSFASTHCADATDLSIFQSAQKTLFADNLEAGNLTLVQAFALSATYLQKRNKPNTGYNYSGIAIRLAIGLGLHKDYPEGSTSPLQIEIRRRVWWTLCVLDVGATVTYGRPLGWPRAGTDAALPRNIHEEDLVTDSATVPPEVDGFTLYTYLRVQSSYHLKTMYIYNRLINRPFPTAAELVALDDEYIGSWLAQMPSYYSVYPPSTSKYALGLGIAKWRYRNLRIVMYRPFLVRWALDPMSQNQQSSSSTENLAVFKCLDAAKETIMSIEEYWTTRSHSRLAAWYVLYFLFHATLIPLHCLRQNPQHPLSHDWRAQIRSSVAIMDAMIELTSNSSNCREITLKLSWPHLQEEEEVPFDGGQASLIPDLGDTEGAEEIDNYNAWCEQMSTTEGSVPMYQWPHVDENGMDFFLGAGFGRGY